MNKIKILHVLATNKFSGAESVVCDIIENSSDLFEHVYCSVEGPIANVLESKKINYMPIKKLNCKNVKKVIKRFKPDIIHAHDFRASFTISIIKGNFKFISHIHNNSPWIKRICINSIIFLFSSLKADKIFIVSNSIKKEYIFNKFVSDKMICVNNPVMREKILSKLDNNDIKPSFVYDLCCVARLSEAKDPFKFLNIVNELAKTNKNIKAVWIGDGDLRNEVQLRCSELNLNNNVDFLGFKENPYIFMKQSKVFILTSKWEGYGLVAFEALTLGKPCVVSNVGGLKNIIDDTCGKLCDYNNIQDYVDEVNKLLSNDNYYNEKSEMAIKKSFQLDNKDVYFLTLESIYKDILTRV